MHKVKDTLNQQTSSHDQIKQSAKMVYVGLSRPTHLLCFAVDKKRFKSYLSDIDKNHWEIIDMANGDNC